MFNRYLPQDPEAFEDLYRPVDDEKDTLESPTEPIHSREQTQEVMHNQNKNSAFGKIDLKSFMKRFNGDGVGILPLILLLFLIADVEEDERLLIIVLAVVLGI